jgi:hypothetical protein
MSFTDRLVLWLHIGFAIFTIGPVTLAIMSTPRYIRQRNLVVVQYLYRMTRLFTVISLAVLIAGIVLAQQLRDFSKPWVSVSLTLFVVAIVLLVMIWRDQRRAIMALEDAAEAEADAVVARAAAASAAPAGPQPGSAAAGPGTHAAPGSGDQAGEEVIGAPLPGPPVPTDVHLANVERGRIASLGGVVSLIWLAILVLMVWYG